MALNFPSSPTISQVYTDATSGFSYEWNGTVWRSYSPSSSSQIKIIDDISGSFNGVTQSFPLTTSGFALSVVNNASLRISLGGVIQSPGTDYSVSGTNIVFTTAPESSLSFSGISLGPAIPVIDNVASVYVKQTYTATAGQTNFNFTAGYTVGFLDVYQNGVRLTAGTDFTAVGGTLFVLTTPANISDEVEAIGYKVATIVTTQGQLDNLNVTGISTLGSVKISSGIVTASSGIVTYFGDGVNLDNAGTTVTNILYVTEDGNDTNAGRKLGDAKATIGGALAAATTGTVIKVSAGSYVENNPLIVPAQVSIIGDSLREVSVSPQNAGEDLFYVGNADYIAEMSFTGSLNSGKAIFAFNPNIPEYNNQSPYIQNCTNFIPNSIGLKIDGSKSIGPTKSMVVDSYTQYNQGGIGVSITNEGYAQLVSLFTICNETAIFCGSGSACDLTNSNSSFGNYGLVADGIGPKKYTGIITTAADANSDTFVLDLNVPTLGIQTAVYDSTVGIITITTTTNHNFNVGMGVSIAGLGFTCPSGPGISTFPSGNFGYIFEVAAIGAANSFSAYVGVSTLAHTYVSGGTVKINVTRPYDGQVVYFDELYYTVGGVTVGSGGTGYTGNVDITFSDPSEPWGIPASAVGEVTNGSVTSVEIISNGRGYTGIPTVTFASPNSGINTATGTANLIPTYYSILRSTPISGGICTITVNDNVPYAVGLGSTVPFFKQSRVLASGHSLEYIGSGTNINSALPNQGGVTIQENEIDMRNGGLVVFTSTDQSGNFRIGDGVVINQQNGTVSGTSYTKSLFSTMTPFILALGGD